MKGSWLMKGSLPHLMIITPYHSSLHDLVFSTHQRGQLSRSKLYRINFSLFNAQIKD